MTEIDNTVLVLFSSGMDSLWVALYYLKLGKKVRLLYIGIPRINGAKVIAEKYFAKRLFKMLRREYRGLVTLDIFDNEREIRGFSRWTQMDLWFEGVEKCYKGEVEIAMGTTWDDIKKEAPTVNELRERRKKWHERFKAKISFPGVLKCKKVMALEMRKYMGNTWTCETPKLQISGGNVRIHICDGRVKNSDCVSCEREAKAGRASLRKKTIIISKGRLTEREIVESQLLFFGTYGPRETYKRLEERLKQLEVA